MPSTGLVPNVGEAKMAGILVNQTSAENLVLHLYKNDLTPTSTMTLADYTEATFTGYAPITLSSSSWEILGVDAYIARSSGSAFTCSGTTSESLYGFYLTGVGSSTLFWSERFDEAPKVISFVGDAIAPSPGIIVTRTSTALDVLTGLVASWPLTESTGTRRDLIGGNDLTPYYEEWVTGTASTASVPAGTVARFTQGNAALTDLAVVGTSGSSTTFVSALGGLPVYTAGQHFHLQQHSVTNTNGMYVATGIPTALLLPCTKQDWSGGSPTDAVAEAALLRNVAWLYHGNRVLVVGTQFAAPFYGFGGEASSGQINLDGALGISLTYWIKIRTGAVIGQHFFVNGVTPGGRIEVSDSNSTVLTQGSFFENDSGGSTAANLSLPALDTWYFIVVSYDPATGKASISRDGGTPILGSAIVGGHPTIGVGVGSGFIAVGGQPVSSNPRYSNADMSQLNLWNKVITAAEITYLMTKRPL